MKIISHSDIVNLGITPEECYHWMLEALREKTECYLQAKTSLKPRSDVFFTSMPCMLPKQHVYGLKMVSRIPERIPALNSTINLYDSQNGEFLAVMDCDWITAMRTGAVATFSILHLAKDNFQTIACIGLGNTCVAVLKTLLPFLKERKLLIKLKRYKNQAEQLIDKFKEYDNVIFQIVEDDQTLFCNSDVILSCITAANHNLAEVEWFEDGVLVVPVHTMGFQNCDLSFDKVVYDDYDHVRKFKYFQKFKDKRELKDLLHESYRTNSIEKIIVYNVGIALFDVYFAYQIYQRIAQPLEIEFMVNDEKEWL